MLAKHQLQVLGPAAPAPRGKADNAAMSAEDPMEYNEPTALGYDLEEFENDEVDLSQLEDEASSDGDLGDDDLNDEDFNGEDSSDGDSSDRDAERQDQVPETRVLGPSGDGPDGSPTFTVWSVNLKRCDKRRNALKRAVRGTRLCPGRHPDVIAVQDAEAGIVFKPMPGYHFWISPKLKLTEKDGGFQFKKTKRGYRSARKNTANADPAQVVNANPAQDAKDGPEFPHVCFYVDKSIPTTAWRVEEADTEANKGLFATLKLTTASGSLAIHNVYNHLDRIDVDQLLAVAGSPGDNLLVGDFNFHHPNWSGGGKAKETPAGNQFAAGVKAVGLELLTKPGTITYSNSLDTSKRSSTLDLTFASGRIRPLMEHCKPLEAAGFMSDHRIIETVMRLDAPREIKIRPRWSRVNRTRFIQTLEPRLPPKDHPLDTHDQMDDYCGMIGRALGETIKDCVPLVRCGYQLTPPTKQESGLDRLRASLTRLETRFRATKDDGLCAEMDRLQQEIKHQEQEHWRCYTEKASKTTKSAYNLAAMGRKFAQPQEPCQVPPLSYDGKIWVDDKDKLSIFEKTLFRENDNPSSKADLSDEELCSLIKDLPTRKAAGPDEIPNEAIKLGQEPLRYHLLRLFNACFKMAYHPAQFKDSILIMARKPDKAPEDPNSWRPIALMPCISKLMEKIVAARILAALKEKLRLLPATQFGGRSTTEALQYLLNIVYTAWSLDKLVTILCGDLSGAYNNVDRDKLLKILVDKGMPAWVIDFIRSFLSDRRASFRFPGLVSESKPLKTGIPQGSPLSPILFLLFASPLLESPALRKTSVTVNGTKRPVHAHVFSFVDDTYFIAVSDSFETNCKALEELHDQVQSAAKPLGIIFGPKKYDVMHFKRPRTKEQDCSIIPNIPGFEKKPKDVLRILGIQVDCRLTWTPHLNTICAKVKQRMGYLKRLSGSTWGPSLQRMRQFYLTKIRPVLIYACGAWFVRSRRGEQRLSWDLKQFQLNKLESLQHACLRKLSGAFRNTSGIVLEKEMYIENVWTLLHEKASMQRLKAISSLDDRWRTELSLIRNLRKRGPKNPHLTLDQDAAALIVSAFQNLEKEAETSQDPEAARRLQRWGGDRKKTIKTIGDWAKRLSTGDCEARWEEYVLGRKISRISAGKDEDRLGLPAALAERWRRTSFKYYRGMLRPQSTMLLHCRTENIGLNSHLAKISVASSPFCPCNRSMQTPFHLFVECSRLQAARQQLLVEVGHTSYAELLTKDAKAAAEWAISYFEIEQFDGAKENDLVLTSDEDSPILLPGENNPDLFWSDTNPALTSDKDTPTPPWHGSDLSRINDGPNLSQGGDGQFLS
ncbi:hypothetical protein ACJ41O_009022 [Fusarium nematophilum]